MTSTTALWFMQKGEPILRQQSLPELPVNYCEIKTICSGISGGTEKLVCSGKVPKELHQDMKCPYMEGSFDFPIKYGYSLVGKVVSGIDGLLGKTVHALHPHQSICQLAIDDLHVVPQQIPAARATLASNMETAINAVWDSNISVGDRVLIVGFGIIGSLVARIVSLIPGVHLQICDTDKHKQLLATQMGFEITNEPDIYDISFHCSATQQGLQLAIDCVDFEGTVVELSWYGTKKVQVDLGTSFHSMRKKIICSQVSRIPGNKANRWNHKRRKNLVFTLLQNPVFDEHLTCHISFEQIVDVFQDIEKQSHLAYVVNYE